MSLKSLGYVGSTSLRKRQRARPPAVAKSRILTTFQAGHGWTDQGGGGSSADDTAIFLPGLGTQSRRLDAPASQTGRSRSAAIAPVVDLTANDLICRARIHGKANLSGLLVYAANETGFTNWKSGSILSAVSQQYVDDEFFPFRVSLEQLTGASGGTFNAASVASLQIAAQANANGAISVNMQDVAVVPRIALATPFVCVDLDDGYLHNLECIAYMAKFGMRATIHVICDAITPNDGQSQLYLSINQLKSLHDDAGADIAAHSDTLAHHNSANGLTDLTPTELDDACYRMKDWITGYGFEGADQFAFPLGRYTPAHLAVAKKWFAGIRMYRGAATLTDTDSWPPVDPSRMVTIGVNGGAAPDSAATINAAIDAAIAAKRVPIVTFHDPRADANGVTGTQLPFSTFTAIIDHLGPSGINAKVRTKSELSRDGLV